MDLELNPISNTVCCWWGFSVAEFIVLWRVLGMTWADFIAMAGVSIVVYLVTKWGARRGFKAYDPRDDEERRRLLR